MSDEVKRPWQFSLGRLLGAITLICITLAVLRVAANVDAVAPTLYAALTGLGSVVGVMVGGKNGAAIGIMVGILVFVLFSLIGGFL